MKAADRIVSKAIKARGLRDDTSSVVAWVGTPPWDGSMQEKRLSRLSKLSFGFGTRSPSSSPTSTPVSSRSPSTVDLAGLDCADSADGSHRSAAVATSTSSDGDSAAQTILAAAEAAQTIMKVQI